MQLSYIYDAIFETKRKDTHIPVLVRNFYDFTGNFSYLLLTVKFGWG